MVKFKRLFVALAISICGICSAANIRYVNCLTGSDKFDGASASRAKKTIQAAVNSALAGDKIYVAPGTYAPFSVDKKLTIIGIKGAKYTYIEGGGKYRCVKFADIEGYELHGFTLQNGYAGKEHGGGAVNGVLRHCIVRNCRTYEGDGLFGGGGVYKTHLYDTIIEGCRAGFGGAMHLGKAHRCTFRKNYAWDHGGALWGSEAHHSLIHHNHCDIRSGRPGGAGVHGGYLYNCTVVYNEVRRTVINSTGGLFESWSYNCIVWNNKSPYYSSGHECHQYYGYKARPNDHYLTDPRFVAPHRHDFHLRHDSPARRIGNRVHLPDYWNVHFDRDRNPRFHGDKIDMGCYEEDEDLNSVKAAGCGTYEIKYNPMGEEFVSVKLDGITQLSSSTNGVFLWQPQSLGWHTNVISYGSVALTNKLYITSLPFAVQKDPVPPMALDTGVVISPTTKTVKQQGASFSISTQGSTSDWVAEASDSWIKLNKTGDKAGNACAYTVSLNTNAETRVGYIYVSGHVYTISQAGIGSTLDKTSAEYESEGGTGTINLDIESRHVWKARPNVDWISVSPTNGMSSGTITYTVAPLYDVTTRSGTITVGGNTFNVFQYGRRMGLEPYSITNDYYTHVYPVKVQALAITSWDVTPNNSWLSIVDAGKGKGADDVTIAMSENPSYIERTGTITIGTETFTVTQAGRTDVDFELTPEETTASANGANGLIAIEATPDLPWSAVSSVNWLTVYSPYAVGSGNGNVAYTVSPNTTVYDRVGEITVTPDPASGLSPYVHTVVQPAANVAISTSGYEFDAPGEATTVTITVANNVTWTVDGVEDIEWLGINGATTYVGPQTITLTASANDSVYTRNGTIIIAGKAFAVSQKCRGVEVDSYFETFFDPDGGGDVIEVYPDGDIEWAAVSSNPEWLTVENDGEIQSGENGVWFWVAEYFGDGASRTGTITIGNKVIHITQSAYAVSVSPTAERVAGNSGAGEISVSADINAVWTAIATEPWITVVTGENGNGNGKVSFTFTDNNTGKTRTGTIIVNGAEYTLTQAARTLVPIEAVVSGAGGSIANSGSYDLGAKIELEAIPDAGYKFSYWTLPDGSESMVNPIEVMADVAKTYSATFEPLTPDITEIISNTDGVTLKWENLPWALSYKIFRGSSNVPAEAIEIAFIENDGSSTYLDETGDIGLTYFYWIEAIGMDDLTTMSAEAMAGTHQKEIIYSRITYENTKDVAHNNPSTYQEEVGVVFTPPTGTVVGYTFAGWDPISISSETFGPQTVTAQWKPNSYSVVYNPNGGSGSMTASVLHYDEYGTAPVCHFTYSGHTFLGWSQTANGEVEYVPGDLLLNLTSSQNGVVMLYAVWEQDATLNPVITPGDGSIFKTETCQVSITCGTPGAVIYYSTNGRTPRFNDDYLYKGSFTISETTTIIAVAVNGDMESEYVEATITYVEPEKLTLKGVLDETKLGAVTTGGDAEWTPVYDDTRENEGSSAKSGKIGMEQSTWLETTVEGKGTLTFWWKVSCEQDPRGRYSYDHATFSIGDTEHFKMDGESGWVEKSVVIETDGTHKIRWTYSTDDWEEEGFDDCMWVSGVTWSGDAAATPVVPSILGDSGATVTGDAANGFTITPSADKTSVEVSIPSGIDASKVTVEVGTGVASVVHNGANVKVVKNGYDITAYLDIPDDGRSACPQAAVVKDEIIKETLDPKKGAKIKLDAETPSLTTPATRPGLTYTLHEGTTLGGMKGGASKLGDGKPWTPTITVKGGKSGFYTIKVEK